MCVLCVCGVSVRVCGVCVWRVCSGVCDVCVVCVRVWYVYVWIVVCV